MFGHRIFWGSLALLGLIAGCKPATPPPTSQPSLISTDKPATTAGAEKPAPSQWDLPDTDKPSITDAKGTDAAVLEQATKDYARAIEQVMAKRRAAAATPQHGDNALQRALGAQAGMNHPEPSAAKFADPPAPQAAPESPSPNPGNASTAGAAIPGADPRPAAPDQVASLTPPVSVPGPTITQTPPSRPEVPFNKDTPAVNTPLIVAQPRPLPATDDMAQKLARQVKDYPQDVVAQLDWQLLQLLQGQSVPQMQSLSTLSGEDREMLSAVLDGVTNFRNALKADSNMLLSRKIRPMLELSDRLRTQAELSIPTVALCTDVKGFGVYEPLEPARFPADMKEHRVIVYCEVENFASQLDEQKRWETKLTQEVVLYTEGNGLEVWRDKTPARPIIDYSRNRRHDFFIVKMVRLPANLTIGRYLLKVTVTDQQVNRVAESTVPVQIVAQ